MSRGEPTGSHLVARSALLVAGGAIGLWGMVAEREWLVWVGLVLLVVAYVLRFKGRRTDPHEFDDEDDEPDDPRGQDEAGEAMR